jgi:GR25 family glycosyltransferase involved in LPS biosynthesis
VAKAFISCSCIVVEDPEVYPGFVISLARRGERLASFLSHTATARLATEIQVEPFAAVDGSKLVLDEGLRSRIRPWNFAHMDERQLRGNLGCTLSHLEIWDKIAAMNCKMAFVFEDDARLIDLHLARMVGETLRRAPADADLVWLNDYDIGRRGGLRYRLRRRLRSLFSRLIGVGAAQRMLAPKSVRFFLNPDSLTTTEAYLIAPAFARKLSEGIRNDLGAVDRHMMQLISAHRARVYQVDPPLFTQRDRNDSETRSRALGTATAPNRIQRDGTAGPTLHRLPGLMQIARVRQDSLDFRRIGNEDNKER